MNKLFAIILTLFLSLPVSVWAVDENIPTENPTKVEESAPIVNTLDEDIAEQEKNEENQFTGVLMGDIGKAQGAEGDEPRNDET